MIKAPIMDANKPNNEILIQAMENTGTKIGAKGWGKDKDGEKLDETADDPYELRTDGTDAWDTLYMGCNEFRLEDFEAGGSSASYFG